MKEVNSHYEIVEKAIQYITAHQKEQPSLDEISQHVYLSKFHLQRVFREWAGVSPKQFLQHITVEQSKALLRQGKSTLETSYEVGLSGNGRLHDLFVNYEAFTPGDFKSHGQGIQIQWDIIPTCFGTALIAETERGICKVSFIDQTEDAFSQLQGDYPEAVFVQNLHTNGLLLKQYFEDWKTPKGKIKIHSGGTPFQIQVWRALLQIPASQLVSYQDISNRIGRPKSVRAVGTAIGQNPIAYLIPCHRVIKSNGLIGNYRWRQERKMIMNAYEQIRFQG